MPGRLWPDSSRQCRGRKDGPNRRSWPKVRPHFYDVIGYVRILSSENCLAVEKDPIRNLFLKLFRLSKEYF